MIVTIAHSITAEIVGGKQLSFYPAWDFQGDSVVLGHYESIDVYEQHLLNTVGSDDWQGISGSDTLRFGKNDLLLQSAWFYLPSPNGDFRHAYAVWSNQPVTYGILRLVEAQGFHCFSGDARWFDPAGGALIALRQGAFLDTNQRLRLRITQDFDLLFANHTLCGWMLLSPVHYISHLWSRNQGGPSARALNPVIYDYLHLLGAPAVEKMECGDPAMLQALLRLREQLTTPLRDSQQYHIVRAAIEHALNHFYPDVLLE